ncbi:hypothetical protein ACIRBX_18450 [Kitasatospora sp. NPDC096147]|uniref:hypothetical protein n=1 Tax=Kitasatospora sp. NPDC096147 TaxID=3364093 RepID=UPI0038036EE9
MNQTPGKWRTTAAGHQTPVRFQSTGHALAELVCLVASLTFLALPPLLLLVTASLFPSP